MWTYEGNEDGPSKWLDRWFTREEASPTDLLTWAWFYGEAIQDSGWTRDKELLEWIEASKTHRLAWDGVQLLLRTLRQQNKPVPAALLFWALDIADGTNKRHRHLAKAAGNSYSPYLYLPRQPPTLPGYFRVNERFRSLPDDLRPRGRCHCCQVDEKLVLLPSDPYFRLSPRAARVSLTQELPLYEADRRAFLQKDAWPVEEDNAY